MSEFGAITMDGKTYNLTEQAELTNRVFPGWFGDAAQGENYTAEYGAYALDAEGNRHHITWQFAETKGEETDDASSYDWTNAHAVRPA